MTRISRPVAALGVALVLALAGCGGGTDGPGGPGGRGGGGPPAVVTTTVLAPAPWQDSERAIGTTRARESLDITAKVSDTVSAVHFESGDRVGAGQVLVTLSQQQESAALRQAQAAYRESQTLFARQQALAQKQLVAASTLDAQRAARDGARARLDEMGADAADRVVRAPFAGVLGLRRVSPGSLVTPGTVITTLDDLTAVDLDFSLPERQLAGLAAGQRVQATSEAFPGAVFEGAIASIDSRVDPATRAVTARARFDNADGRLRAGMLLELAVDQARRSVLQVPELALQQVGQQAFVFRVKPDDTVEQVPVTVGARRPGWVELTGGVRAGERVVVEGIVKLKDGAKIADAARAGGKPAGEGAARGGAGG